MLYSVVIFTYLASLGIQTDTALIQQRNLTQIQEKVYFIPKGEHRSQGGFDLITENTFRFNATFDSSAIYQTVEPIHQADVNKLYGFSDCFSGHQTNSARFGWRWLEGKLEIMAYCYQDGERYSELITTVEINKTYEYEIEITGSSYIFRLNQIEKIMPRGCGGSPFGYKLFPYFGGQEVAPHDITIKIQDL
jgi:hypothetical protein